MLESVRNEPVATEASVLATIAGLIEKVVEGDVLAVGIGPTTSFSQDIELESIEFVALAEELQGAFPVDIQFTRWLGGMTLDEILALKVGHLVDFVETCLK